MFILSMYIFTSLNISLPSYSWNEMRSNNVIPTICDGVQWRMAEKNHFRDVFAGIIVDVYTDRCFDGKNVRGNRGVVRPKI